MERDYILVDEWLAVPFDDRLKLREVFKIGPREPSVVVDNRIISDGVSQDTLKELNVKRFQEYLDVKKQIDVKILWAMAVNKAVRGILPESEDKPKVNLANDKKSAKLSRGGAKRGPKGRRSSV